MATRNRWSLPPEVRTPYLAAATLDGGLDRFWNKLKSGAVVAPVDREMPAIYGEDGSNSLAVRQMH
jgi:hypothetical protein